MRGEGRERKGIRKKERGVSERENKTGRREERRRFYLLHAIPKTCTKLCLFLICRCVLLLKCWRTRREVLIHY